MCIDKIEVLFLKTNDFQNDFYSLDIDPWRRNLI